MPKGTIELKKFVNKNKIYREFNIGTMGKRK